MKREAEQSRKKETELEIRIRKIVSSAVNGALDQRKVHLVASRSVQATQMQSVGVQADSIDHPDEDCHTTIGHNAGVVQVDSADHQAITDRRQTIRRTVRKKLNTLDK